MSRMLVLHVRFHDGRYHGRPEWPPSPARVFQALVAAAAKGSRLLKEDRDALGWLEKLSPPAIAAPAARSGNSFRNYVPNNDLDAVGGDPRRISEIRTPKLIRPRLFDARTALSYAWQYDEGKVHAERVCDIAEEVYQLGRGVDMAWAWAEIIDGADMDAVLTGYGRALYRPSESSEGMTLGYPQPGSLESLERRFERAAHRFIASKDTGIVQQLFSQAPKARFGSVAYDSSSRRFLFELRQTTRESPFATWPLARISKLVEAVRDIASERMKQALRDRADVIDRVFIGREAKAADKAERIRVIPLPSIGSPHVVRSIRRVLVEVPPNCPLSAGDIAWAFSSLDIVDSDTGEIRGSLLPSDDASMLGHYGIGGGASDSYRVWRTVTPAALPDRVARRRIDPRKLWEELRQLPRQLRQELKEAKLGSERLNEEARAAASVNDALRHAEIRVRAETVRVQREPFDGKGARAETFANGTRFRKERLWHLQVEFAGSVRGPLVIGDGRYLGLGLMAPVLYDRRDILAFRLSREANISTDHSAAFLNAVRRALMALARDMYYRPGRLFSGHEDNGAPARSGRHEHVFLAAEDSDGDGRIDRLVVAAPWACDRTMRSSREDSMRFERVVSQLERVRAGSLGVITLKRPTEPAERDLLIGPARVWENCTPYRPTRHVGRRKDPAPAIVNDMMVECERRGLPRPEVELLKFSAKPNGGHISAHGRLTFAVAVKGPLFLGRDSHEGGGVFSALMRTITER
jgi:CRISPR-associated protein Csb2